MRTCAQNHNHQSGFVFTWASFLTLPLLSMGFIFLFYGLSNVAKIRAQLDAMNAVIIGGFSAEFDTDESLNAMAMYAAGLGFSGAAPVETGQAFDSGALIFEHDSANIGAPRILAYMKRNQGPLTRLVSHLGDVETSGFSLTTPDKFFTQISIDYSESLVYDQKIDDLLTAFGVFGADKYTAGANGVVNEAGEVIPSPAIENALPGVVDAVFRYPISWSTVTTAWPSLPYYYPSCVPGPESTCNPGGMGSHRGGINFNSSDQFMSYKRAATILVGVIAQSTPFLDVYTFSGPMAPSVASYINFATQGSPAIEDSAFEPLNNSGHFPLWKYDEVDLGDVAINLAVNPVISASVTHRYSFGDPKNPFTDSIQLSPSRPSSMAIAPYVRKALKYFTFLDKDGNTVASPGQYSAYFEPPLPVRNDYVKPTDSFVHDPGPLTGVDFRIQNSWVYWYGWPYGIVPFMASSGLAHVRKADMPADMTEIVEYNCETGPPVSTNVPLSQEPGTAGWAACKLYDWCLNDKLDNDARCDATNGDGSPAGSISAKIVNAYYDETQPISPGCSSKAYEARCPSVGNPSQPSISDYPFCVNGIVRCGPSLATQPLCWSSASSAFSAERPSCTPGAGDGAPVGRKSGKVNVRGYVSVPENPPAAPANSLFFALMDMGIGAGGGGGTYTHEAVADANARCAAFKESNQGQGECVLVIVTDGRPKAIDANGVEVISDAALLAELTEQMDSFTVDKGGKVFTWFLGNTGPLDRVVRELTEAENRGTLDSEQVQVFHDYIETFTEVPEESCKVFETMNIVSCSYYNEVLIPERTADASILENFKDLMDAPPNRVLIETSIENTASGGLMPESFISGLKEFLAVNKREIKLGM